MEFLFLGQEKTENMAFGADQGRAKRGISLVTDIHTNAPQRQVLQVGLGHLLDLFVSVPDTVGRTLTQGVSFSYFEFKQPMSKRLTNDAWYQRVRKGLKLRMPSWTQSFVESF